MKIWMHGHITERGEAKLSVLDHGLLYGDGVFEGIRAWNGRVFRLDDHLQRLSYGARALHLSLPMTITEFKEVVQSTVDAHGGAETYIRLLVTRGSGPLGIDTSRCTEAQVVCIADELRIFPKERKLSGIDLCTASRRRPGPDVLDPRVKSLNYLNNVMARIEANRAGADSALMLNAQGMIAETDVANIFVVQDGILHTPPTTDGSLDGITRRTVREIAEHLGVETRVRSLTPIDLYAAEDAFLSGTGAGIVRIRSLDGQPVGRGEPTQLLADLMEHYRQAVLSG
ncbi:MAG: aminotransferase class IV [Myxococcales bacterium]|nr:aminotransferase class IV [Myxococcales bacterium]